MTLKIEKKQLPQELSVMKQIFERYDLCTVPQFIKKNKLKKTKKTIYLWINSGYVQTVKLAGKRYIVNELFVP